MAEPAEMPVPVTCLGIGLASAGGWLAGLVCRVVRQLN
jgi:hypothetical protein